MCQKENANTNYSGYNNAQKSFKCGTIYLFIKNRPERDRKLTKLISQSLNCSFTTQDLFYNSIDEGLEIEEDTLTFF